MNRRVDGGWAGLVGFFGVVDLESDLDLRLRSFISINQSRVTAWNFDCIPITANLGIVLPVALSPCGVD